MHWNEQFIRSAIPEVQFYNAQFPAIAGVSIDSRTLKKGELFVALSGNCTDGHEYVSDALKKGAAGLIIEAEKKECLKKCDSALLKQALVLLVSNTMDALVQLARTWRSQFSYPVVGITGSVGKTSTKELLCTILSLNRTNYLATPGNNNTIIGVSLAILSMRPEHEVAIFEMGISKRGEMAKMVQVVKPTTAIITSVGHAHMEGLGSIHDIALEKREIFSAFKEDNIGVINGDQPLLSQVAYHHPVIKFGSKTTNQVQARKINVESNSSSFVLKLYGQKYKVSLPTNHTGAVNNALGAMTLGYLLKVPTETLLKAVQMPVIVAGRFEKRPLKSNKGTIINDCYNANPESMKAALLAFEKLDTKARKIAILGDMLELGVNSPFWHRQLGRFLRKVPSLKKLILVGTMTEWTEKTVPVSLPVQRVKSWKEAQELLQQELKDESMILVKGSNGLHLSNIIDALT